VDECKPLPHVGVAGAAAISAWCPPDLSAREGRRAPPGAPDPQQRVDLGVVRRSGGSCGRSGGPGGRSGGPGGGGGGGGFARELTSTVYRRMMTLTGNLESGSSYCSIKALKPNEALSTLKSMALDMHRPALVWFQAVASTWLYQVAVNLGSTWGQPGVNLGSTWVQPGINLGSAGGQLGVNLGSAGGQPGFNLGSSCTALPGFGSKRRRPRSVGYTGRRPRCSGAS